MAKGATLASARSSKEKARRLIGAKAEVVGAGIIKVKTGSGFAIKVNVKQPPSGAIAAEVEGVPIVVEVVGTIRKR